MADVLKTKIRPERIRSTSQRQQINLFNDYSTDIPIKKEESIVKNRIESEFTYIDFDSQCNNHIQDSYDDSEIRQSMIEDNRLNNHGRANPQEHIRNMEECDRLNKLSPMTMHTDLYKIDSSALFSKYKNSFPVEIMKLAVKFHQTVGMTESVRVLPISKRNLERWISGGI